ncbi:MAG TPA: alpha/beta hydrolase [Saprospiraceae bacterium]|nr:alpha/beta hydrolase [Saprospiraceae bacterium]
MKPIYFTLLFFGLLISACTDIPQQENETDHSLVYLNYTESGLDSAYSQSFWAPNSRLVFNQIYGLRALANEALGKPERITYGETEAEKLDLYRPKRQNSPIHIYVHGGAWRSGNGSGESAYNARKFVERGIMYLAPDYELVTDAEGSLYPMVEQLRRAIIWTYQNARTYGGDPNQIYLSGHSAGGHLGGVLITTDWQQYGLPADVIKGAYLSSGMYDLYPVSLSSRNEYVTFTEKMIQDLSPAQHAQYLSTPVILAHGTAESPEFKRQTEAFAQLLQEQGKEVNLQVLEGYNHFEIMIALGNPYDLPGQVMLQQMGLD